MYSTQSGYAYQDGNAYQPSYDCNQSQYPTLPLRSGHRTLSTSSSNYSTSSTTSYGSYGSSYGSEYPSSPETSRSSYSQQSQSQPIANEYICLYPCCPHTSSRKADLERHVKYTHNRDIVSLVDCMNPSCHRRGAYGFTRKDKMVEHMREVHKADIPKRGGGGNGAPGGRRDSVYR